MKKESQRSGRRGQRKVKVEPVFVVGEYCFLAYGVHFQEGTLIEVVGMNQVLATNPYNDSGQAKPSQYAVRTVKGGGGIWARTFKGRQLKKISEAQQILLQLKYGGGND